MCVGATEMGFKLIPTPSTSHITLSCAIQPIVIPHRGGRVLPAAQLHVANDNREIPPTITGMGLSLHSTSTAWHSHPIVKGLISSCDKT